MKDQFFGKKYSELPELKNLPGQSENDFSTL